MVGPVLQKHKKCFAYVKDPCVDLVRLNDMLGKSNVKMINGLHIRIYGLKVSSDRLSEALQENLVYLQHWPLQYLHVDGFYQCDKTVCTTVTKLVQELLWTSRATMKELAIEFSSDKLNYFDFAGSSPEWRPFNDRLIGNEDCLFPKLKSIELLNDADFSLDSSFHSFVLNSAPNLTEVKGQLVSLSGLTSWSEAALKLLTWIELDYSEPRGIDENIETVRKLIRSEARLHTLAISEIGCVTPLPSSWFDPLAQLLRNNRLVLNQIDFCAHELMKFICLDGYSGILVNGSCFPNVRFLRLYMPWVYDPIVHRSILRRLNIGVNFPKLIQLDVDFDGFWHEFEGEEYDMDQDHEQCPSAELQLELNVGVQWCAEEPLEYFLNTFPLLTKLQIDLHIFFADDEHAYSLSQVFSTFKHLKELRLEFHSDDTDNVPYFSLDAIFCGINFKEAKRLRRDYEKNELDLARMEIVPTRPGLAFASSKQIM